MKKDTMMKNKLIYTIAFLLSGTILISSCDDMLNVDSNRVEYEFDDWSLNDSVYSVLGILKAVQEVGDRQVLINELRADLVTVNGTKAVADIQDLADFQFDPATNKYLDVKDYYSIINNCNIYLARVDTTLQKNNIKLMMPEYVAVKSIRAWTYLQLAINYNNVPYFTEPILTHSAAEEIMNRPMLNRDDIITKLIAELLPYENPAAFPMPAWDNDGKVLKFGYIENGSKVETEVATKQLFVPVRMLLGELYLWRGDYKNAARFFYSQIAGSGTNETASKYNDYGARATYSGKGGKTMNNSYLNLFSAKKFDDNSGAFFSIIPYASTELEGTTSELSDIFSPVGNIGGAQVSASPGIQSLARRQMYCFISGKPEDPKSETQYSMYYEYPGDLRIKATTYQQRGTDVAQTEYKNIIAKFNVLENSINLEGDNYTPAINTPFIIQQRKELAYLRLAEALVGLEREGYKGAMELAMELLKSGLKKNYRLLQNPDFKIKTSFEEIKDSTDSVIRIDTIYTKYLASCTDSLRFNFAYSAFENNIGIHSRGSGECEYNKYYALNDTCIARYIGAVEVKDRVETLTREITYQDSLNYITDLVIDELALELAWEGTRFGDLIRFAKATGDNDVLAKRIAGRAMRTDKTYRHPEYHTGDGYNAELYSIMSDENNWYLPLPGNVVQPVDLSGNAAGLSDENE